MNRQAAAWWQEKLRAVAGYYISAEAAATIATWHILRNVPLVIEGPAGVGKTTLIEGVNRVLGGPLYRLTCYDSITAATALYRWNETLQRAALRPTHHYEEPSAMVDVHQVWWDERHLIRGKLAQALADDQPEVGVLIDEVDKVPEGGEFENSLLEFLDRQVITVNERQLELRRASGQPPLLVALTSNAGRGRARETLSEPLRRRAVYLHLSEPTHLDVVSIFRAGAPQLDARLAEDAAHFFERARRIDMAKPISLAEGKAWARALQASDVRTLTEEAVLMTVGFLAKGEDEQQRVREALGYLLKELRGCDRNGR